MEKYIYIPGSSMNMLCKGLAEKSCEPLKFPFRHRITSDKQQMSFDGSASLGAKVFT